MMLSESEPADLPTHDGNLKTGPALADLEQLDVNVARLDEHDLRTAERDDASAAKTEVRGVESLGRERVATGQGRVGGDEIFVAIS